MSLILLMFIFTISIAIFSASVIFDAYSVKNNHNSFSVFQQQKCSNGSCTVTNCSNNDPCKTSKTVSNRSSSPFSLEDFSPTIPDFLP
ncbi:MAG: hypothetical protein ACTHKJ_10335 [Candidatus Nitrosocosmicus sp.]